jgi:hypothetical protein
MSTKHNRVYASRCYIIICSLFKRIFYDYEFLYQILNLRVLIIRYTYNLSPIYLIETSCLFPVRVASVILLFEYDAD